MTMPVLFIGHGSPENALADNEYSRGWKEIAKAIPRPQTIPCISAHWVVQERYL
jgi:4,5-DOPA dioxygenase extradiol